MTPAGGMPALFSLRPRQVGVRALMWTLSAEGILFKGFLSKISITAECLLLLLLAVLNPL